MLQFSSVSVMSGSLSDSWTAALQASLSITNSWSLLQLNVHWLSDAIQPSHPLLSPSPTFSLSPASGSFPMSQFFTSGSQSIRASASVSVLPVNIQGWFPLGLTGLILQFKELSRVFSNTTAQKHQFFGTQLSLGLTLTSRHGYWKNHSFNYTNFFWHILQFNKYWLRTEFLW